MTTDEMPELLPCPFCGDGNIEIYRSLTGFIAVCGNCNPDGAVEVFGKTRLESVIAWNTRPTPPADAQDRPQGRFYVEYDEFIGDVVGYYTTREGKRGVVLQQIGTKIVHVYGESRIIVHKDVAVDTPNAMEKVKQLLEGIAKRPDLPNPDRDADWKNCQKWSSHDAKQAIDLITAVEKESQK